MKHAVVLAASGLAGVTTSEAQPSKPTTGGRKRPNLVYVFPDQMRRQAMGFMRADPVRTPNLDAFAARSVVLDNACSTYPICSPHRASLMTGQYPQTTGFYSNCRGDRPDLFLNPDTTCFPDVLHDAGYHVGYIGKWHLERGAPGMGYASPWVAKERRHKIDFWHSWCDLHSEDRSGVRVPWESSHFHFGYWQNDSGPEDRLFPGPIWSPIYESNVAIDYINNRNGERDATKPFALFVSWNPPHNPYLSVPANYMDPYRDASIGELLNRPNVSSRAEDQDAARSVRGYFGAVTGVDDQFGRILEAIRRAGLEEDTIIVFTSDHGDMMGSHGRMGKPYFWEEAFGVPFLISWKNVLMPRRDDLLIGTPDIMPTLLGLMGLADRIPPSVEGADYAAALRNEPDATRPEFAWYYNAWNARGVRTRELGCYFMRDDNTAAVDHLYDLARDPFQLENLAAARPGDVRALGRETRRWLEARGDRFESRRNRARHFESIPG